MAPIIQRLGHGLLQGIGKKSGDFTNLQWSSRLYSECIVVYPVYCNNDSRGLEARKFLSQNEVVC